ncbi:MAG TPA: ABC transporter permease [Anaeromyxobacteraceae bacterium]|nr:ABC transporter permease [Anaeromyxobacteraceae bacterium]
MRMIFFGGLRRRWPEHLLVALVIAAIVTGLGALRGASSAAEAEVHDLAHRLGRNMLLLPADTDPADFYAQRYRGGLPDSTPESIRASPAGAHVSSMEARLYGNLDVRGTQVIVVGEDAGWAAPPDGAIPVVVGEAAARALGLQQGASLEVKGERLIVTAVAQQPPDGLDTALFVPLSAAQRLLGAPGQLSAIRLAGCWCRVDVRALGTRIESAVPGSRAITVAALLEAQKGTVDVVRRYGALLHLAAVLLVGALVAALSLSGARRRARELGLLVAIGAEPATLGGLLVLEAALVGLAGGLLGSLAAGPATRWLIGAAAGSAPSPSVTLVLGAAALSALAATLPARHAAALDPAASLRETAT